MRPCPSEPRPRHGEQAGRGTGLSGATWPRQRGRRDRVSNGRPDKPALLPKACVPISWVMLARASLSSGLGEGSASREACRGAGDSRCQNPAGVSPTHLAMIERTFETGGSLPVRLSSLA